MVQCDEQDLWPANPPSDPSAADCLSELPQPAAAPRALDPVEMQELSPAEAATMLGITEDEVLHRQRFGRLRRLSWKALQDDALDEFVGPP